MSRNTSVKRRPSSIEGGFSPHSGALLIVIILLLFFFNIGLAESPRNSDSNNHFELVDVTNVSGHVKKIKISPDKKFIVVKTSTTGLLLGMPRFFNICNFQESAHDGLEWDGTNREFADGTFIRDATNCRPRDILYGESISWNKDGRIALTAALKFQIWQSVNASVIHQDNKWKYISTQWAPNYEYISVTHDSIVDILKTKDYALAKSIIMETDEKTSIEAKASWSPDSQYIAYNSNEEFIQLIDVNNGTVFKHLYGFTASVTSFTWSPDGKYLIAASRDNTINLYDLNEDNIFTLKLNNRVADTIDFGVDYREFIIGTSLGTVEHWKFRPEMLLAEAGPDLYGFVDATIEFHGSSSLGDISPAGYSWTISDNYGPIATLVGKDASFSFSQPGDYRIILKVEDVVGNTSEDFTIAHIFATSEKPTVLINSPLPSSEIYGMVVISGTANDDISVRRVEIQIDEGGWLCASGTSNWQYSYDTRAYVDGAYVLYVRAYDDVQSSEIVFRSFSIKNSLHPPPNDPPPLIKIIEPKDNVSISGNVLIRGTAEDNTFISEVTLRLPNAILDAQGGKNWFIYFNTTEVPDGFWIITAVAYDEYQQTGSAAITILINNSGQMKKHNPKVGITYPLDNTKMNGTVVLTGWAWDDLELKIVQVQINDSLWYTCNGLEKWHYELNSSKLQNGYIIIRARAFDGHLFSTNATLSISIVNDGNNTGEQPPKSPQDYGTYIISSVFLVLLFIIISILIYLMIIIKKGKGIIVMIIVIIFIGVLIFRPFQFGERMAIIHPPPEENHHDQIDNCSLAADFTFMSLRDASVHTNEIELGKVVFIYFTWEWGYEGYFDVLKELSQHYRNTSGVQQFQVIVLNGNQYISEASLNQTMRKIDSDWDYQKDDFFIRRNFGQDLVGKGWIIIDKHGCTRLNEVEATFNKERFERIIDPLIGH